MKWMQGSSTSQPTTLRLKVIEIRKQLKKDILR